MSQDTILYGSLKVLSSGWNGYLLNVNSCFDLFLHKNLFELPESYKSLMPKCKYSETRHAGFELIYELCKDQCFLLQSVRYLEKFHSDLSWRTSRRTDWVRCASGNEKSPTGYTGIRNLGCTCYMNSLMQLLYMIPSIREEILHVPTEMSEENILFQLQRIFSGLKNSDKPFISTRRFCRAYKDFDGNPVNMLEQKDADEFFGSLMERVENILKGTEYDGVIQSHFGGHQVIEANSKDCSHRTQRFEPFLSIPIEVKNKKSVLDGLRSFVEGEILEGDNAYLCEQCDAKVKAHRRTSIKHLPNFLMLALRRFEFNFETMKAMKLNDYLEFPMELDMEPYTQEGLERRELDNEDAPKKFEDEYYHYKLRGVIIHTGDAERGHYYSFIYDESKKIWIDFNDTMVYEISASDIPAHAFGGLDKNCSEVKQKIANGYLLLYERQTKYKLRNPESDVIEKVDLAIPEGEDPHAVMIKEKNKKYWKTKYIFGNEYSWFVLELSRLENPPVKFIIQYFLTIQIRNRDRGLQFVNMFKVISKLIEDREIADWFLEMITVQEIAKEILIYCPVYNIRQSIVGLAKQALRNSNTKTKKRIIERVTILLPLANRASSKYFSEFLSLFSYALLLIPEIIIEKSIAELCVHLLFGSKITVPFDVKPDKYLDISLGYTPEMQASNAQMSLYMEAYGASFGHLYDFLWRCTGGLGPEYHKFLKTENAINTLISIADSKLSLRSLSKFYAFLYQQDYPSSEVYMNILVSSARTQDTFYKPKFLVLLSAFMAVYPAFEKEQFAAVLEMLFDLVGNNPTASEMALKYLFKITSKNSIFLDFVKLNTGSLEKLGEWIAINMHYTLVGNSEKFTKPMYQEFLAKLQRLIHGEKPYCETEFDSDDEIPNEILNEGAEIDILDTTGKYWTTGRIEANLEEALWIKYKNNDGYTWKYRHSEQIAPPSTRSQLKL